MGVGGEWVIVSSGRRDEGCGGKAGACTTMQKNSLRGRLRVFLTLSMVFNSLQCVSVQCTMAHLSITLPNSLSTQTRTLRNLKSASDRAEIKILNIHSGFYLCTQKICQESHVPYSSKRSHPQTVAQHNGRPAPRAANAELEASLTCYGKPVSTRKKDTP